MREMQLTKIRFTGGDEQFQEVRCQLRRLLRGLGCEAPFINELVLAVQEAMANVVRHAYEGNETGELILCIRRCGDELVFRLTDFAPAVDWRQNCQRDMEEVRPGGLGRYIMHRIMDRVEYVTPGPEEGNVLEMAKRLEGV